MEEQSLYEDSQFRVATGKKIGECSFYIKNKDYETYHRISIDAIREIVKIPRGQLEDKLDNIDPKIKKNLKKAGLSVDSAHLAICLAYIDRITSPRDSDLPSCAY